MAHQQESFLPFSSRQSLSCCLSRVAKRSPPKPHGPLYSPSEPCGPFPHFRTAWPSPFPLRTSWFYLLRQSCLILSLLLQNLVVLSFPSSEPCGPLSIYLLPNLVVLPFTSELRGLLPIYFGAAWSLLLPQNLVVLPTTLEPRGLFFLWLPGLGLNPSAHLPLQPHL